MENEDVSLAKNKSNFTPKAGKNKDLDKVIEQLRKLPYIQPATKGKCNISGKEREALNSLSQNESIVIKQADKGGATVLMDNIMHQRSQ